MAVTTAPDNQFAYVILVARRARQIMSGARPMVDNPRARKPTRVAEEEVQHGLIEYEPGALMDKDGEESGGR